MTKGSYRWYEGALRHSGFTAAIRGVRVRVCGGRVSARNAGEARRTCPRCPRPRCLDIIV